ncbi:MAG TPA: geranylgeranyl reductase family protein [Anaerolineae bacterium]|nr:geranylgeranyl reductase family protein [Anaerolineae bacterium]
MVTIGRDQCAYCGGCVSMCPSGALELAETRLLIDQEQCSQCELCLSGCPTGALTLETEPPQTATVDRQCDVVVVGAGPAGTTAARSAADRGHKVLLLEKRQEIGSPVRCAEGINREMLLTFLQLDECWISARVRRSEIVTADTGEVRSFAGEETGYILERRVFDRALAEKAVGAGTSILLKTAVQGLITKNGVVRGVRATDGHTEWEIEARIVIGADGVESRVGHWAGLDCTLRPSDSLVCAQYLLAGLDVDPECCLYYVGSDLAPGGYAWVFPKGEHRANVGLGVQADLAQASAMEYLERFIDQHPELERGSPVTLVAGSVPVGIARGSIVTDGLMLVGDAARQADPLTGGGTANAMLAGRLAAEVAAKAVEEGDASAGALKEYERRWQEGRGRQMQRNYRLKERFSAADRASHTFQRVFAVATAGK